MSDHIVSRLNDIISELDEDREFVCAAHLQMVVDKLSVRSTMCYSLQ
jgi:hypothetical protein